MYRGANPFLHKQIDSPIQRMSSFYKILSIFVFLILLVVANSFVDMIVLSFYLFVIIEISNVSFRVCFSSIKMFKFVIFLILFVISCIYLNVFIGLIWAWKFIDMVIYLSVMVMCTSFYEIYGGVYSMLRPFSFLCNCSYVAYSVVVGKWYLGCLYEEDMKIRANKRLRGVRFDRMSLIDRMDYFVNELGLILKRCSRLISRNKMMLEIRNCRNNVSKCNYRLNKWGKVDTILLVINVMIIIIVAIY